MSLPILQKCCCCFELETGVFWIAFLGIFGNLIQFTAILSQLPGDGMRDNAMVGGIIGLLIAILVYGSMLFGTMKRRPNYLLPWLFINFCANIAYGIGVIAFTIESFSSVDGNKDVSISIQILVIFIAIIFLLAIYALAIHIFLAVYSLYIKIKNQKNQSFPSV